MRISALVVTGILVGSSTSVVAQPGSTPTAPAAPAAPAASPDADTEIDFALKVARGTFKRARRAVAFGPTIGAASSLILGDEGGLEVPISFGLGLVLFDVPVLPDAQVVKNVIQERLKARVMAHVKLAIAGGKPQPTEAELEALAVDIYQSVKAEVLGELSRGSKRFEKPRLAVHLEGGYWPRAAEGDARLTVLWGIGPIAIGPSIAAHVGDGTGVSLGLEADFHVQLAKGPRSHPLAFFVRGEYGATSKVDGNDLVLLGARLMLDLI